MRFTNRLAYIVGGSTGIGFALAGELRRQGARVVLFARRAEQLARAREQLESEYPDKPRGGNSAVSTRTLDVSDRARVEEVFGEVLASEGPPDLLVNSAGYAQPGRFEERTAADLEASFSVNVLGTWNTVQVLLDALREGSATIINISSVAGLIGIYGLSDYCVTKFGVVGLSEALRQELAPHGVRVHVLCPPDTDTPGLQRENETKPAETKAVAGAARRADPATIARRALRAVERGRFLIVLDGMSRLALLVKSLAPRLFFRIVDGIVRRARRRTDAGARTERTVV